MNNKLGRLRLDTLRDIQKQKYKQAKDRTNSVFETHGDKHLIISNYDGRCAVCQDRIKIGQFIWFDRTKPVGKKTAHRDCWKVIT